MDVLAWEDKYQVGNGGAGTAVKEPDRGGWEIKPLLPFPSPKSILCFIYADV